MLVLEDFEPLTIEEFQDLKLNAPTFLYYSQIVCVFYTYNANTLIMHFIVFIVLTVQ